MVAVVSGSGFARAADAAQAVITDHRVASRTWDAFAHPRQTYEGAVEQTSYWLEKPLQDQLRDVAVGTTLMAAPGGYSKFTAVAEAETAAGYVGRVGQVGAFEDSLPLMSIESSATSATSAALVDEISALKDIGANASANLRTGGLRRELIRIKVEANAERWVRRLEASINESNPAVDAHFVQKHGPDIATRPNLERRAIDGTNPRTGITPRSQRPSPSSQFKDWRTQMNVLNEATTRTVRGLSRYNFQVPGGGPAVVGYDPAGIGHGFFPNPLNRTSPTFVSPLNGWIVRFDRATGLPFTAYATR